MGQTYDVSLRIKTSDVVATIEAMNDYIDRKAPFVRFSLDGVDRANLDDLMKVFITDRNFVRTEYGPGDWGFFSGFDASYSWGMVISGMFEHIAGTLEDGSELDIDADEYRDAGVVEKHYVNWEFE